MDLSESLGEEKGFIKKKKMKENINGYFAEVKDLEKTFDLFIKRWNELAKRNGPPLEDRCNKLGRI